MLKVTLLSRKKNTDIDIEKKTAGQSLFQKLGFRLKKKPYKKD